VHTLLPGLYYPTAQEFKVVHLPPEKAYDDVHVHVPFDIVIVKVVAHYVHYPEGVWHAVQF